MFLLVSVPTLGLADHSAVLFCSSTSHFATEPASHFTRADSSLKKKEKEKVHLLASASFDERPSIYRTAQVTAAYMCDDTQATTLLSVSVPILDLAKHSAILLCSEGV